MGGIGKSALALRVAHHVKDAYPDGQLYADLRGTGNDPADPGTVLASLLAALGVPRREVPASLEDRARLFRTVLDGRRLLLLLDDARDIAQIKPLLPGAAGCAGPAPPPRRPRGPAAGRATRPSSSRRTTTSASSPSSSTATATRPPASTRPWPWPANRATAPAP
jgi:hypothetical protein